MSKTVTIGGETIEITDRNRPQYEAFIAASKQRDAWPKKGDECHIVYSDGEIISVRYSDGFSTHLAQGRIRPTLAEAEQLRDKEQAQARIDAVIREKGLEYEWTGQGGWGVGWNHRSDQVEAVVLHNFIYQSPFYAATEADANAIIAACEADLKIVLGVK